VCHAAFLPGYASLVLLHLINGSLGVSLAAVTFIPTERLLKPRWPRSHRCCGCTRHSPAMASSEAGSVAVMDLPSRPVTRLESMLSVATDELQVRRTNDAALSQV